MPAGSPGCGCAFPPTAGPKSICRAGRISGVRTAGRCAVRARGKAPGSAVDGTAEQATLQTGGNQANNIAEFVQTLEQNPYEMGFFGGMG